MAKYKVIDETIIDGYIANLQKELHGLKAMDLDEESLPSATLVLQVSIAIYETIKGGFATWMII